jgi:hypothetical protein
VVIYTIGFVSCYKSIKNYLSQKLHLCCLIQKYKSTSLSSVDIVVCLKGTSVSGNPLELLETRYHSKDVRLDIRLKTSAIDIKTNLSKCSKRTMSNWILIAKKSFSHTASTNLLLNPLNLCYLLKDFKIRHTLSISLF